MSIIIQFLLLVNSVMLGRSCEWNYIDSTKLGPTYWSTLCAAYCASQNQSPININTGLLTRPSNPELYTPLQITMGSITNATMFRMKNSGHTLAIYFDNIKIGITGSGLPGLFYADYIHWHWGYDKRSGSEHTLDGKKYMMEGHLVTFNSKYSSLNEAMDKTDGIAVIGMFYTDDSAGGINAYDSFLTSANLNLVQLPEAEASVAKFDINYLLPFHKFPFFRYNGSLTTPMCNEQVTWTLFSQPVSIRSDQMDLLRNLLQQKVIGNSTAHMVDNYRPVQPLNGRSVFYVDTSPKLLTSVIEIPANETVKSNRSNVISINSFCFAFLLLLTAWVKR